MTEKYACRCPTEFCRLEPDNGAEYCPDLREDEFCGYRPPDWCPTCTKPYAECRCNGVGVG